MWTKPTVQSKAIWKATHALERWFPAQEGRKAQVGAVWAREAG